MSVKGVKGLKGGVSTAKVRHRGENSKGGVLGFITCYTAVFHPTLRKRNQFRKKANSAHLVTSGGSNWPSLDRNIQLLPGGHGDGSWGINNDQLCLTTGQC